MEGLLVLGCLEVEEEVEETAEEEETAVAEEMVEEDVDVFVE